MSSIMHSALMAAGFAASVDQQKLPNHRPLALHAYEDALDGLGQSRVRYLLVGGVAVVHYGHHRPIRDLDLLIDTHPGQAVAALSSLTSRGFSLQNRSPSKRTPRVLRLSDSRRRPLDLFIRSPISFERLWASSAQLCVGQTSARVLSLEHLLYAKLLSARPHDFSDIVAVLAHRSPSQPRRVLIAGLLERLLTTSGASPNPQWSSRLAPPLTSSHVVRHEVASDRCPPS